MFDEVKKWSEKVEKHKEEIQASGIQDSVIEDFDVANLKAMTDGYGTQAIDRALSSLRDWHDQHYWFSKASQSSADEPAEQAAAA
jgi:D-mannonate dehydratase